MNAILTELDVIDQYLQQLPGIFVTALDNNQRKIWATDIKTAIADINDLLQKFPQGPTSNDAEQAWQQQILNTKSLLESNMDYQNWGFEQYAIVASGISALSGLAKHKDALNLFPALVTRALAYYVAAVDGGISSSFQAAVNSYNSGRQQAAQSGDGLLNAPWCTGYGQTYTPPHGGHTYVTYTTYTITGSVEGGIGAVNYGMSPVANFMPGTSGSDAENQGISIVNQFRNSYLSYSNEVISATAVINSCNRIINGLHALATKQRFLKSV